MGVSTAHRRRARARARGTDRSCSYPRPIELTGGSEAVSRFVQTECDQVRADQGPRGAGAGWDYRRLVYHKGVGGSSEDHALNEDKGLKKVRATDRRRRSLRAKQSKKLGVRSRLTRAGANKDAKLEIVDWFYDLRGETTSAVYRRGCSRTGPFHSTCSSAARSPKRAAWGAIASSKTGRPGAGGFSGSITYQCGPLLDRARTSQPGGLQSR